MSIFERSAAQLGRRVEVRARCLGLLALAALGLLSGCASSGTPDAAPEPEVLDDPYLLEPTAGYPLAGSPDLARQIEEAYDALRFGADPPDVATAAAAVLEQDPGYHPAAVLMAQVEHLTGEDAAAVLRLKPVVDELPDYRAAQLILGRAAELSGDVPAAYQAFAQTAAIDDLASLRAEELRPRALEIVLNRLRDDSARGRVEDAESQLAWLEEWAAESFEALEGARLVAIENDDPESELAAVRQLAYDTGEVGYRQREAELEVEVGDLRSGLEKLEALVAELPDDPDLAESLAHAEFLWRLQLLPPEVQDIGRKTEIDRADLSTLLYWLIPRVRSAEIANPPIAGDILDHPRRDVIVRVLNLGLMEIDETLHRFEPQAVANRVTVLQAQLALLASAPRKLSCLDGAEIHELDRSWASVCRHAARCQLLPEAADCRPSAAISGGEALELLRRTLNLLGSS